MTENTKADEATETSDADNPWNGFPRPSMKSPPLGDGRLGEAVSWEEWVAKRNGTEGASTSFAFGRQVEMPNGTRSAETTALTLDRGVPETSVAYIESVLGAARRKFRKDPHGVVQAFLSIPGIPERLGRLSPGKIGAKIQQEIGVRLQNEELSALGLLMAGIRNRGQGSGPWSRPTPSASTKREVQEERRRREAEAQAQRAEAQRLAAEERRRHELERWGRIINTQNPEAVWRSLQAETAFKTAIGFEAAKAGCDEDGVAVWKAKWKENPLLAVDPKVQAAVFALFVAHRRPIDEEIRASEIRSARAEAAAETRRNNEAERSAAARTIQLGRLVEIRKEGAQATARLVCGDARIEWILQKDAYGNPALAFLTQEEAKELSGLRPKGRGILKGDVMSLFPHIKPSELETLYTEGYLPHIGRRLLRTIHGTVDARLYDEAALSRMTPEWMATWREVRTAGKKKK